MKEAKRGHWPGVGKGTPVLVGEELIAIWTEESEQDKIDLWVIEINEKRIGDAIDVLVRLRPKQSEKPSTAFLKQFSKVEKIKRDAEKKVWGKVNH